MQKDFLRFLKIRKALVLFTFVILLASLSFAQTSATVDTVIIVNAGDKSNIDAAIAAGISSGTGIPVLYTDYKDVDLDLIKQFQKGEYKDATNIVIIGGPSVVSPQVQKSLEEIGKQEGFDVARISGTTATGTAVEAVNYFYGPGMLNEVAIVKYTSDGDKDFGNNLMLASQLGKPIIPVPEDVNGLPADIATTIDTLGIDKVSLVGDFQQEREVKNDLAGLNAKVTTEIDGDRTVLESRLKTEVEKAVQSGDKIIFTEKGDVPPILPGHKIFFYRDENNDNIDDESGSVLDGIGRGLYDKFKSEGKSIEGFKFYGDDEEAQSRFKKEMERVGVKVSIGKPGDTIETAIRFTEEEAKEIGSHFARREEATKKAFEENKAFFESKLPEMREQFKAFYTTQKDRLSTESLEIGAKIIDEANKDDAKAQWQLMHAFANTYKYENYVSKCDSACIQEQIGLEKAGIDEKTEKLIGRERAREVANLDAGKKLGIFRTTEFIAPGDEEGHRAEMQKLLASGVKPEELYKKYVEESKEEAYDIYNKQAREEYTALRKGEDPGKWTPEQLKAHYEERLGHESEAYLAGLIKPEYFDDPVKRGEVFSTFTDLDKTFETKGIKDTQYLTHEDWKDAYEKYSSNGKLSDTEIKKYEAAATAYKTYEMTHEGEYIAPVGGQYNEKTGQYSFVDPTTGSYVGGKYDSRTGSYTYTNEKGELVQGTKGGEVHEYSKENLPSGYTYDVKAGTYSYGGTVYTPPVTGGEYKAETGTYVGGTYTHVDPTTGHEQSYTPPKGSTSYTPPSGSAYTYTDPGTGQTHTYVPPSGSGTTGGTTEGTTGSTGGTYTGGTTGSTGGDTGGYTAPSGGSTGGDTGGYTAPSGGSTGGDTGGHTAPSGGGH